MSRVRVRPNDPNATHEMSLSDGARTFGIKLLEGAKSIQENPATPSNIRATGGASKFGDWDPTHTHIEMRNWINGRGLEAYSADPAGYYDSMNLWGMTPEAIVPAPQWNISSGLRAEDRNLPGDVAWRSLIGDELYVSANYLASTTYDADKAYVWLRRVGSPGTLTMEHRNNAASSEPGTVNKTITVTSSLVVDVVSEFYPFDWATTQAQSSGTRYHIVLYGAATDNMANHWELGVNSTQAGEGHTSADGTTWAVATFKPYYRVVDADRDRKMHMFPLGSSKWYGVTQHTNGSSVSQIYQLTSGTAQWAPLTLSTAGDGNLNNTEVGVIEDVVVLSSFAAMAAGPSTTIRYFRQIGSSYELRKDATAANIADRLHVFYSPDLGPELWFANSSASNVSHATVPAWNANCTCSPATGIPIGTPDGKIMEITDYSDTMYVRKTDSMWMCRNDRAAKLPVGIGAVTESVDYLPMIAKDLYLFFSWSHSLEQLYGGTLTDLGPWRGAGMPSSRAGQILALESGIGMMFCALDAGSTGISSVLAWNGIGYHEIFRAPHAGMRIYNLKWQAISGQRPKLWINCDGEMYYLSFPKSTLNPLRDPEMSYQHEAVLETATVDMDARQLPKLFSELYCIGSNLCSTGIEIPIEYQVDEEIGGSSWTPIGTFVISPSQRIDIHRGNVHQIRLRARLLTSKATIPPVVNAFVLKGVARTPVKRQFTIRARAGSFQVTSLGLPDHAPDAFYAWFQDAAVQTVPLHMRTVWDAIDDLWVYAEPPSVMRTYTTPSGEWGAEFSVTVREL